jgi:hypothetical protein
MWQCWTTSLFLLPQTMHCLLSQISIPLLNSSVADISEMARWEYAKGLPWRKLSAVGVQNSAITHVTTGTLQRLADPKKAVTAKQATNTASEIKQKAAVSCQLTLFPSIASA